MTRKERAQELFLSGYNCAQATAGAFADLVDLPFDTLMKMTSAFGGGMGRLREVCGAMSGISTVLGLVRGYDRAEDADGKKALYAFVQRAAAMFREQNGSIICRDLVGQNVPHGGEPTARTADFYKKRPCVELVGSAAEILEKILEEI